MKTIRFIISITPFTSLLITEIKTGLAAAAKSAPRAID
jgi:hypothetical protein